MLQIYISYLELNIYIIINNLNNKIYSNLFIMNIIKCCYNTVDDDDAVTAVTTSDNGSDIELGNDIIYLNNLY